MIKNEKIEVTKDFWYYDAFEFNKEFKVEYTFPKMRCTWGDEFTTCEFVAQDAQEFTRARINGRVYFLISKVYINENLYKYTLLLDCKTTYPDVLKFNTWVNRASFEKLEHESIDVNYPKKYTNNKTLFESNGYFICCNATNNERPKPVGVDGITGNYTIIYLSDDLATSKYYFMIDTVGFTGLAWRVKRESTYYLQKNPADILVSTSRYEVPKNGTTLITISEGARISFKHLDLGGNDLGEVSAYVTCNIPVRVTTADGKITNVDYSKTDQRQFTIDVSNTETISRNDFFVSLLGQKIKTETTGSVNFEKAISDITKLPMDILSIQKQYAPVTLNTSRIPGASGELYYTVKNFESLTIDIEFADINTPALNIFGDMVEFDALHLRNKKWLYSATIDALSPMYKLESLNNESDSNLRHTGSLDICLPYTVTKAQEWSLTNSQTLALHEQTKTQAEQQYYMGLASKAITVGGAAAGSFNPATAAGSATSLASAGVGAIMGGIQLALDIENKDINYRLNYLNNVTQPNTLKGSTTLTASNLNYNTIKLLKSEFFDRTLPEFMAQYGITCNMPFAAYTLLDNGFISASLLACPLPKPVVDVFRQQLAFWYKS